MYVINKKRLSLIAICVLLAVFSYVYEGTKATVNQKESEVTATPVSSKVIVVDARTWYSR